MMTKVRVKSQESRLGNEANINSEYSLKVATILILFIDLFSKQPFLPTVRFK